MNSISHFDGLALIKLFTTLFFIMTVTDLVHSWIPLKNNNLTKSRQLLNEEANVDTL